MADIPFYQPSPAEAKPIAIVDIGSNTVRLVVYESAMRTPFQLFNEGMHCGLGRALADNGDMPAHSIDQTLRVLKRFRAVCQRLGVDTIHVLATAAVRDARNAAEFIKLARDAIGADIQILTGEREAELALLAIRMGFAKPDGICGDMGGGSLELVNIGDASNKAVTLPLGGLKLLSRSNGCLDKARSLIKDDLSNISWLKKGRGRSFYPIGGIWRALAALHMDYNATPLPIIHGYRVECDDINAFCDLIIKKDSSLKEFIENTLTSERAETLPYGALTLLELIEKLSPKDICFSAYGIREGLLYSLLTPEQQSRDPLLAFSEDFARLRSRSYEYAIELCRWTDQIFEAVGIKETKTDCNLRHAACLLSDIEWPQRDNRGEMSLYAIAHAPVTGLDHSERIFLAMTVYHCHAGKGESRGNDPLADLRNLIDKQNLIRARQIAAAVRAANVLAVGMPGVICDVEISRINKALVLRIPHRHADLLGEKFERRLKTLKGKLKLKDTAVKIV
ncbi:MAG: Ppx/GppA phosphatase family protein [Pseudomonadota bacterium]